MQLAVVLENEVREKDRFFFICLFVLLPKRFVLLPNLLNLVFESDIGRFG